MTKKEKLKYVINILEKRYGNPKTELNYETEFQLMVAVILSAQCTDARVNIITKRIFPRLDSPAKMITLSQQQLEKEIHDCGLYRSKSKHILEMCRILLNNYDGQVPEDFDALVSLPGVGRKTANVVRSVCWGYPGIAVDTHVFRVSNRLKLSIGDTPLEVEEGLQKAIPKENWSSAHHWLIWHGRKICKARKPACEECFLQDVCPSCLVKVSPWENNIK